MNLRRRCEKIVRSIDISEPLPIADLCRKVSEQTGRPILLQEMSLPAGSPSGLWLSTGKIDYIFHDSRASQLHKDHVIAHELGHILCDHRCDNDIAELTSRLMPNLAPEMILRVLHRSRYDAVEEQEAEIIASLLMYRTKRRRDEASRTDTPVHMIRRIERTLLRNRRTSS
ncbi:ImmA/IrrE family metallo-endopeptidase [Streptomyces olindensis]|uniref:ImmA/IrrE family metallo-endopeptidase n=1 Tax=Streptomyces olindensis TaxID=358823 RepID=UPI0036B082A8